ncbi:hypothetical protein [Rhizobium sp. RAF56]|jgi:hypothetical protein|uniref:hypothetical protein n=1 Tax=Rhizobium sp. RAF56 TaxID=3233062 RepID=UPI003F9E578D
MDFSLSCPMRHPDISAPRSLDLFKSIEFIDIRFCEFTPSDEPTCRHSGRWRKSLPDNALAPHGLSRCEKSVKQFSAQNCVKTIRWSVSAIRAKAEALETSNRPFTGAAFRLSLSAKVRKEKRAWQRLLSSASV